MRQSLTEKKRLGPETIWELLFLSVIIAIAIYLRLRYIQHYNPWIDEYSTMLAAKMITQKGIPIFPSGLFYDHGIFYSYLAALCVKLGGFSETVMRLPSLVAAVLTIPSIYYIGRKWFSGAVGLLATVPYALMADVFIWGGRARMYGVLMLLVLWMIWFLYQITQATQGKKYSLLALFFFVMALLTHFNTALIVPPMVVAFILAESRVKGSVSIKRLAKQYWFEAIGGAVIIAGSVLLKRLGQPKGTAVYAPGQTQRGLEAILDPLQVILKSYTKIAIGWDDGLGLFVQYFSHPDWLPLVILLAVAAGLVVYRWRRDGGKLTAQTRTLMFLVVIWLGSLTEILTLVSKDRRDPKYLVMLFPVLAIIAAAVLAQIVNRLKNRAMPPSMLPAVNRLYPVFMALTIGGLAAIYLPGSFLIFTGQELGYNHTFRYVDDHLQQDDVVITALTSACALYLDKCHYYATQFPAQRRMLDVGDTVVDRWAGAELLQDTKRFKTLLKTHDRLWFVADRWRLETYYDVEFRNLIFNQMTAVKENENSIAFLKEGKYVDITPKNLVSAVFGQQIELWGFDGNGSSFAPGDSIDLTLTWRVISKPQGDYTIFVHVRDAENNNITQQDFRPFDGTFPTLAWDVGETLQLPVTLALPDSLPAGEYRIVIGLYELATMKRLSVVPDTAGENAINLQPITIK